MGRYDLNNYQQLSMVYAEFIGECALRAGTIGGRGRMAFSARTAHGNTQQKYEQRIPSPVLNNN